MDSEQSSFIETLINSRNRDISLFLPFFLGLNTTNPLQESTDPPQETQNQDTPSRDRIILINPFTQGMVVIERRSSSSNNSSSLNIESLLEDLFTSKSGQPPASKASIDALPTVEVEVNDDDNEQCVICLEEWQRGEKAKEMPCKHRFHGDCIEKWLKIHGSCPVCRHEMPVDETEDRRKISSGERGREVWLGFTFGSSDRRSNENLHETVNSDS
ncbi:hypothetical protein ACJIZ3_025170 [Penstemon smallii]|uniref:RING-type E3 ubiquitin transferase n=1 Tax=Penstemon smallii TaxID=265156 RepID=A0ABD3TTU6_9LAMI